MAEATKKSRIRIAETVESGVEGLFVFLVRYLRTTFSVILYPRQSIRRLLRDRHTERPKFVLPLTYLAIGVFLLSLLAQIAGTNLVDWIWYSDEFGTKVTDTLSKEISLVKVATQAIPGVVAIYALITLQRLVLRVSPVSRRLVLMVFCYGFGAQAFILFCVAFGAVAIGLLVGNITGKSLLSQTVGHLLAFFIVSGLLASIVGPIMFGFSALRLRRIFQYARVNGIVALLTLLVCLIFGHQLFLHAARIPLEISTRAAGPTGPQLGIQFIKYLPKKDLVEFRVAFTIKNRGSKSIDVRASDINVSLWPWPSGQQSLSCKKDGVHLADLTAKDGLGQSFQFVSIDPGKTHWMEVKTSVRSSEAKSLLLNGGSSWGVVIRVNTSGQAAILDCGSTSADKLAT